MKMAGGEKAKSSGEYGEKIVKNLLELFGWKNCNSGVTVPCVYQETHKKKGSEKSEKHGIDYVFQYKSPLRDATKHDVLISVDCMAEQMLSRHERAAGDKAAEQG